MYATSVLARCWDMPYGCNSETQYLVGRRGRYGCWQFDAHRAAHLDSQRGFVALFAEVDSRIVGGHVSRVISMRQVDVEVCHVSRHLDRRHRGT